MGSMHIVCPHCTTSYAINPSTLGPAGRTVRCSRCKETWLARLEDAIEMAAAMPATMPVSAQSAAPAANDAAAEWEALAHEDDGQDAPVVESPSISPGWPADGEASQPGGDSDWPWPARLDAADHQEFPFTTHRHRQAPLVQCPALLHMPYKH